MNSCFVNSSVGYVAAHTEMLVPAPREVLVPAPREVLVEAPREMLVPAPREVLVATPREVLVPAPREVLVEAPREVLVEVCCNHCGGAGVCFYGLAEAIIYYYKLCRVSSMMHSTGLGV